MAGPVEIGEGDIEFLVASGLLKRHQATDRNAVGETCLAALEQWAEGPGAHFNGWIGSTVGRAVRIDRAGPVGLGLALELGRLGTECIALRLIC